MHPLLGLSILILLFFLSAFFSGSEAALTSLSRYRIRKIVTLQKSLRKVFTRWLQSPQVLLTTILVGNTVVNISLSVLATFLALSVFYRIIQNKEIIEFFTWIVITSLVLIFGEMLPKIYSRIRPEQITLKSIKPLVFITKIISPVVKPFIWLIDFFTRRGDSSVPVGRLSSISVEEIKHMLTDPDYRGLLEKETREMIEGALKLDKMKVREIMVPQQKLESINIDVGWKPEKILARLIETGRSRIPVYQTDRNKIVGIVLLKDLSGINQISSAAADVADARQGAIGSIEDLIRPAYCVPPNKNVKELLREFRKGSTHCAMVVDNSGKVKGFVTLEDVLEEIVGEILDEYDLQTK